MAVCLINLNEKEKACLGTTICILCVLEIFIGLIICGMIIYFHIHLQWQILLIEGYNSQSLFKTIVSLGGIIIGLHLIGSKICYDCGHYETRKRFDKILFVWVIFVLVLAITELAVAISCFAHTLKVYYAFKVGLLKSIELYMEDPHIKYKVDKLQLEYECCGSESFHDWMLTDWTPSEFNPLFSNPSLKEQYSEFYKDVPLELLQDLEPHQLLVVPFSCCQINNMDPCFHDYTTQESLAFGSSIYAMTARDQWWTTDHGLHRNGCAHSIMDSYNNYLTVLGYVFLAAFGIQVVVLILVRYLDTSISNMELLGDEEKGISPGWICEDCG